MAVDFMVMPLSRYIAGDFVTPVMQYAWQQGVPYFIFGPDGKREFPPDTPFGGPGASEHRLKIQTLLDEDLRQLPTEITNALWNERSSAESCFHRVESASYAQLVEFSARPKRSLFGLIRKPTASHLTASLFLPCQFSVAFDMKSPFERRTGSALQALEELKTGHWPQETTNAVETLRVAFTDAIELKLPMIVDT
jgi:hypothetical protein